MISTSRSVRTQRCRARAARGGYVVSMRASGTCAWSPRAPAARCRRGTPPRRPARRCRARRARSYRRLVRLGLHHARRDRARSCRRPGSAPSARAVSMDSGRARPLSRCVAVKLLDDVVGIVAARVGARPSGAAPCVPARRSAPRARASSASGNRRVGRTSSREIPSERALERALRAQHQLAHLAHRAAAAGPPRVT